MDTKVAVGEDRRIGMADGRPATRVDVAISGRLEGFVGPDGARSEIFSDVPEFTLGQYANTGPYHHAVTEYSGDKGSGFVLLHPEKAEDWDGRLWLVVHGAISYPTLGDLAPRETGRFNPRLGRDDYVALLLDRGSAVAFTRRASTMGPKDDETAVGDDGTVFEHLTYIYFPGIMRDYAAVAQRLVEDRLGRRPSRTYLYGHSAGAGIAHLLNYAPGRNRDASGERIFDGFIADDTGLGYYLPTLVVDGTDVLFTDEASRADMVPQIDLVHAAHVGDDGTSLWRKRENYRLLLDKGVASKSRHYEVSGSSHFDAGRVEWIAGIPGLGDGFGQYADENLDLTGVVDALVDVLQDWVEDGREPPPSRSGEPDLDGSGNGPLELPEIACPTGVYYPYPEGSSGTRMSGQLTAFAAYDGTSPEPVDGRGQLLDMNGNGVADRRESVEEAWRRRGRDGARTGVLAADESFTEQSMSDCVEIVARDLVADRLLSTVAGEAYRERVTRG